MTKKLSKREGVELVTKGYLKDQNYITKEYFHDYLDERLDFYFKTYNEMHDDKFQIIFEELRAIREDNARRLEICENRLDRTEKRLGII
jgi:hypothetical protein